MRQFYQLLTKAAADIVRDANRRENESAIRAAKRSPYDRWFRRQWYRGTAIAAKRPREVQSASGTAQF
jgi:hypothetical protein